MPQLAFVQLLSKSVVEAVNEGLLISTATYTPGTYVTATQLLPPPNACSGSPIPTASYVATPVVAKILFLCDSPIVASSTTITCTAPPGVFSSLHVMIAIYGLQSHLVDAATVSFPAPLITAISPDQGPTAGDFNISILGEHMGPDPAIAGASSFTSDNTLKWPLMVTVGNYS